VSRGADSPAGKGWLNLPLAVTISNEQLFVAFAHSSTGDWKTLTDTSNVPVHLHVGRT